MNEKNLFIPLFKHEFSVWRRRKSGGQISKVWWLIYLVAFLLLLIGFTTWAALNESFQLPGTWYITFPLPFMLIFFGYSAVIRELKNHTAGWWLTLPYSRKQLIWAKFWASWVKTFLLLAASNLAIILFAAYITLLQSQLGLSDLWDFMITGWSWYLILLALSPFAVSLGIFTSALRYTHLSPSIPICFIVYYLATDLLFLELGIDGGQLYEQFSGDVPVELFPYPLSLFYPLMAGWILSYVLIHGAAYLLHKKLSI